MRILVLSPGFPLDGDQYGYRVAAQVAAVAAHHEVRVLSVRPQPTGAWGPVEVEALRRRGRAARAIEAAARARGFAPDLIWALWIDRTGPLALALRARLGCPVVASVMGGELANRPDLGYGGRQTWSGRRLVQAVLRGADRVTVGSRWLAPQVRETAARVRVAPVGVSSGSSSSAPASAPSRAPGPARLHAVVDVAPVKGAVELFAGLARLRADGVEADLTVHALTPPPGRDVLERRAAEAGVAEHVTLAAPCPAPTLQAALPRYDAHVSASHHESQGLALIEAALAGVPVVAPDVGVARALAERGAATLVADRAPDTLARALRGVLEAPAASAAAAVAAHFGLAPCTARWLEVFEEARR